MAAAVPCPGADEADPPPDEAVDRMAAIDDYLAGRVGGDALAAHPATAADESAFSGLLDTLLLLRQSAAAAGAAVPLPCSVPLRRVGRYEIRSRAGEGGFATVWEAWDPLLHRRVALKLRRPEALLSPSARRRFVREAEIASRLLHPQIVTIYEVAADGDQEFIAQEFCAGGSLADWLTRHPGPLPATTAARIVHALARAVATAHAAGVIHRDIKPANVLLASTAGDADDATLLAEPGGTPAARCTVKLADFGLGKVRDESGDPLTQLTRTGVSIGTPAWMAPEQIDPAFGPVGPATDVHGLGLLLDRLLTGRTLRGGGTTVETYRQVLFVDATPADGVVRGVPRDLAAVCLRCLARRPADRYPSAAALAADLERWLAGRPTVARPLSTAARLSRLIARQPTTAALVAGTLAAAALAGWALVERGRAAQRTVAQQEAIARRDAAAELRRGFEALRGGNVAASLAHLETTRGLDRPLADSLAGRWLRRRWHGEREILLGPPVAAAARPRDLYAITLAPHGRTAAVAGADGSIRLLRELDRVPHTTVIPAHDEVNDVCFAADGGLLASVGQDGRVCWWRIDDDALVLAGSARPGSGPLYAVAFTADGQGLVVGGEDLVVWRLPLDASSAPRELYRFQPLPNKTPEVESVVAASATTLAAACGDTIVLLDAATGNLIHEFERPGQANRKPVFGGLTVSPDGKRLMACGTDATAHVWDMETGRRVATLPSHPAWVHGCSFSGDGQRVATACRDGSVRIFALDTGAILGRFVGHEGRVWSIVFEPGGTLLSTGADGTLRRWDPRVTPDAAAFREVPVPGRKIDRLALCPPGAAAAPPTILAVDFEQATWRVDLATSRVIPVEPPAPRVVALDHDPSRERLAMARVRPPSIEVSTSAAAGTRQVVLPAASSGVAAALCWSPAGDLVVADTSGLTFIFPPSLAQAAAATPLVDPVHALVAAPVDPPRVAAAGRKTAIIPLPSGWRRPPEPLSLDIGEDSWTAAWSPDGSLLAVGTRTGRVLLFDGITGAARGRLTSHERLIEGLAFSIDGRCLVTADAGCVRISDVATLTTFDEIRPGWQVLGIRLLSGDNGLVIAGSDSAPSRDTVARLAVMEFERP